MRSSASRDVSLSEHYAPGIGVAMILFAVGFLAFRRGHLLIGDLSGTIGATVLLVIGAIARARWRTHLFMPRPDTRPPVSPGLASAAARGGAWLLVGKARSMGGKRPLIGPISGRSGVSVLVEADRLDVSYRGRAKWTRWRLADTWSLHRNLIFFDASGDGALLSTKAMQQAIVDVERSEQTCAYESGSEGGPFSMEVQSFLDTRAVSMRGRISDVSCARIYETVVADASDVVICARVEAAIAKGSKRGGGGGAKFVFSETAYVFWGDWRAFCLWIRDGERMRLKLDAWCLAATLIVVVLVTRLSSQW